MIKKIFNSPNKFLFIVFLSNITSCNDFRDNNDSQAPLIQITSPLNNSTQFDSIFIALNVADNSDVQKVDILIDGLTIKTLESSPWEYIWNVNFFEDGQEHSIQAVAEDFSGNSGYSEIINITIPISSEIKPTLLYPSDQDFIVNNTEVELSWNAIPNAEEYILFLYSNPELTDVIYNDTSLDTNIIIEKVINGKHFWRIKATNGLGKYSTWSDASSFYFGSTITDLDGNIYRTIQIGSQEWMVDNLKVSRYRNGDLILMPSSNTEWNNLVEGGISLYNYDQELLDDYGYLYNGYSMMDERNIAPIGWHIPTEEEWQTMVNQLGGITIAGGKIKGIGTSHWARYNIGATNESGFTALPGGYILQDGTFRNQGSYGYFGTASEVDEEKIWYWKVQYDGRDLYRYDIPKQTGLSVRCVKD